MSAVTYDMYGIPHKVKKPPVTTKLPKKFRFQIAQHVGEQRPRDYQRAVQERVERLLQGWEKAGILPKPLAQLAVELEPDQDGFFVVKLKKGSAA